jgi:hypothetical protein
MVTSRNWFISIVGVVSGIPRPVFSSVPISPYRIFDPCHDSTIINYILSSGEALPDLSEEDKINLVIMAKGHELLDETSSYENNENIEELFEKTIEKMKKLR